MSNIHHITDGDTPRSKSRTKPVRAKKATAADIARAIKAADQVGLTIYSVTIEGDKVHLQTRPTVAVGDKSTSEADAWFARRG